MSSGLAVEIDFTKMDGLGNDFVVVDVRSLSLSKQQKMFKRLRKVAITLSDRRRGVGFDQLLLIRSPSQEGAAQAGALRIALSIIDADGTIAEMCGNGVRAVHVYLGRKKLYIETLAGLIETESRRRDQVRVKMSIPNLIDSNRLFKVKAGGQTFQGVRVDMGNPHFVMFREGAEKELERFGPLIEKHRSFQQGTNVEWVRILSNQTLQVDVWERGSGKTLACGTGACASYVAAVAFRKIRGGRGQVIMPGGKLEIEWKNQGEAVFMTGPAKIRFRGQLKI